ncbi:MAG: PTS sugar transporter subunit IIA [Candidatus Kaelpia aquatica]|nr:PTS sugar transporter subunit IIA [Candidatus Kaelpia aquatica]
MKISELLDSNFIKLDVESKDKREAIKEIVDLMQGCSQIEDLDSFLGDIYAREKLGSTGIGEGIALPHARSKGVKRLTISFGRSLSGVDFDALDANPAHLIFLIGTPFDDVGNYLKTLAQLSRLLKKEYFRKKLLLAESKEEVLSIFKETEE